jgi:uncharacterized RDD family membrane protein YckC
MTDVTTTAGKPTPYPGLARRLAAIGYDILVLFGVLFVAGAAYQGLAGLLNPGVEAASVQTGDVIYQLQPPAGGPLYQFYLGLVIYGFFALFWHRSGQTLGMLAWRLKVQDLEGNNISWRQTALRFAAAGLSWSCLGAGYWWLWFDRDRRTWHDRLSGTEVILLPKKK